MDEQTQTPSTAPSIPSQPADPASQPSAPVTPAAQSSSSVIDSAPVTPAASMSAPDSPVTIEPSLPSSAPIAPLTSPSPTTDLASSNAQAPTTGSKKKILLVEDDESLANVYITRLTAEGFDVKHVPNGEDALAGAINYKPDLILLDVMMPRVSGFDVLDIIRNTPETANAKIIMLTALSQDADKQRAESLGVNDYLVKSQVVIADVVDRIRKQLNI